MATSDLQGTESPQGEVKEGCVGLLLDEIILTPELNKQLLGNKEVWVKDGKFSKPYLTRGIEGLDCPE